MADIHISQESVQNILKKMKIFTEESNNLMTSLKRAVMEAESNGWKDESYYRFRDEFENMSRRYSDAVKDAEDNLIPRLNHINAAIDNF